MEDGQDKSRHSPDGVNKNTILSPLHSYRGRGPWGDPAGQHDPLTNQPLHRGGVRLVYTHTCRCPTEAMESKCKETCTSKRRKGKRERKTTVITLCCTTGNSKACAVTTASIKISLNPARAGTQEPHQPNTTEPVIRHNLKESQTKRIKT